MLVGPTRENRRTLEKMLRLGTTPEALEATQDGGNVFAGDTLITLISKGRYEIYEVECCATRGLGLQP